jgi:hypothetical protein
MTEHYVASIATPAAPPRVRGLYRESGLVQPTIIRHGELIVDGIGGGRKILFKLCCAFLRAASGGRVLCQCRVG